MSVGKAGVSAAQGGGLRDQGPIPCPKATRRVPIAWLPFVPN
jgi:hypothetical protein